MGKNKRQLPHIITQRSSAIHGTTKRVAVGACIASDAPARGRIVVRAALLVGAGTIARTRTNFERSVEPGTGSAAASLIPHYHNPGMRDDGAFFLLSAAAVGSQFFPLTTRTLVAGNEKVRQPVVHVHVVVKATRFENVNVKYNLGSLGLTRVVEGVERSGRIERVAAEFGLIDCRDDPHAIRKSRWIENAFAFGRA